jgi:hypothetical protein
MAGVVVALLTFHHQQMLILHRTAAAAVDITIGHPHHPLLMTMNQLHPW